MKLRNPFKKNVQSAPKITLQHTEQFHQQKHRIGNIIITVTDDHEIIHGARALNQRFPKHLDRHTKDFDIFTQTPEKDARETEKKLDKEFGGDFFYVVPGIHPGTWKVKAHATGETYADYTKPESKVPFDKIGGINFATLAHMKRSFERSLADPFSSFRREKDKDALNRILIYEKKYRRNF